VKKLLLTAVALSALTAGALMAMASGANAADKLRFALVPKAMNNPYFDLSRDGCMEAAKKLGVECVYIGPVEHEPASEAQIVQDLITQGIDGLAISVADVDALTNVINQAVAAGIPTITFDADAPGSKRQAFVGTDNYAMGKAIGYILDYDYADAPGGFAWKLDRADYLTRLDGAYRFDPDGPGTEVGYRLTVEAFQSLGIMLGGSELSYRCHAQQNRKQLELQLTIITSGVESWQIRAQNSHEILGFEYYFSMVGRD